MGRMITTLQNTNFTEGIHQLQWDATDDSGHEINNGIYFIRIDSGNSSDVKKIVVLR